MVRGVRWKQKMESSENHDLQAGRYAPWCQILQRRHLECSLQKEYQIHKVIGGFRQKQFQESNESVMHGKSQQNILSEMFDSLVTSQFPGITRMATLGIVIKGKQACFLGRKGFEYRVNIYRLRSLRISTGYLQVFVLCKVVIIGEIK